MAKKGKGKRKTPAPKPATLVERPALPVPPAPAAVATTVDEQRISSYKSQIRRRIWMTVNYLTVPLASALIFGFAALCEYILFSWLWYFLATDRQNPTVALLATVIQAAIAYISLVGALVHSIYGLYGTIQIERQLAADAK
jgi:hypothetical protein